MFNSPRPTNKKAPSSKDDGAFLYAEIWKLRLNPLGSTNAGSVSNDDNHRGAKAMDVEVIDSVIIDHNLIDYSGRRWRVLL
jgi:hypothetical protein